MIAPFCRKRTLIMDTNTPFVGTAIRLTRSQTQSNQ
jgi:hypothetical protein